MKVRVLQNKDTAEERVLYMAMDLSKKRWRPVFGDGRRRRVWDKKSNEPYDIVVEQYYGYSVRAMTGVL